MSIKPTPQLQPKPPLPCAWGECDQMVERGTEYSFVITFATRGADGRLGSFQCPDIDEIMAGNLDAQHFCCSPECAAKCAHACIDEHIVPQHHEHVDQLAALDAALVAERAAIEEHRQAQATHTPPATEPAEAIPVPLATEPPLAVPIPLATEPPLAIPIPLATEPPLAVPATEAATPDPAPAAEDSPTPAPIEPVTDVTHETTQTESEPHTDDAAPEDQELQESASNYAADAAGTRDIYPATDVPDAASPGDHPQPGTEHEDAPAE